MNPMHFRVVVAASNLVQVVGRAQSELSMDISPALEGAVALLERSMETLQGYQAPMAATKPLKVIQGGAQSSKKPPKKAPKKPAPLRLVKASKPYLSEDETEEQLAQPSPWDPDGITDAIEVSRCRALLLEIIRRAAHDWVLYRQHERLELKARAQMAYTWLFEEGPSHPWWRLRQDEKRMATAFLVICDELDLDPETVRRRVRQMDIKSILSSGRPAERRRRRDRVEDHHHDEEYGVVIDLDLMTMGDNSDRSSYENYYAVNTPAYL